MQKSLIALKPEFKVNLRKLWLCSVCTLFGFVVALGQTRDEIKFQWGAAESPSHHFDKAIMLVPIQFESDTTTYFLQFDTGSTHSYLYPNRLPNVDPHLDSYSTSLGIIQFRNNNNIKQSKNQNAPVGTLGADFLQGKVIRIKFDDQTIHLDRPYNAKEFCIMPLLNLNGRPVIELTINGKKQKVLYDTGSSLFGLWTSKKHWEKLRDRSDAVKTFPISSWGKINYGYYSKLTQELLPIFITNADSVDLQVWYVDNKNFKRFFRRNNLFGILGNQPFLSTEVILDYREEQFGFKAIKSP